ncbi:hypothetical protein SUGI_0679250 [Cryptomeria japonica]|nr:hypothetical protein SUGI_0679250 [Cryptomeria japonica]
MWRPLNGMYGHPKLIEWLHMRGEHGACERGKFSPTQKPSEKKNLFELFGLRNCTNSGRAELAGLPAPFINGSARAGSTLTWQSD